MIKTRWIGNDPEKAGYALIELFDNDRSLGVVSYYYPSAGDCLLTQIRAAWSAYHFAQIYWPGIKSFSLLEDKFGTIRLDGFFDEYEVIHVPSEKIIVACGCEQCSYERKKALKF